MPIWDDIGVEHGSFGFKGWDELGSIPQSLGARAVLEAIAYVIRSRANDVIEAVEQAGLAGGGAQSGIWRQVVADALGMRLIAPQSAGGAWGAASIASMALGYYFDASLSEAVAMVTTPNPLANSYTRETARRAAIWYNGWSLLISMSQHLYLASVKALKNRAGVFSLMMIPVDFKGSVEEFYQVLLRIARDSHKRWWVRMTKSRLPFGVRCEPTQLQQSAV
jgi:hypothetical protein